MQNKHKFLLTVCLIFAMLLQVSAIYADNHTSLSDVLATEEAVTYATASTSSGIITGLEDSRNYYIMNVGSQKLLATQYLTDTDGNAIAMRDRYEVANRQWTLTVVSNSVGILTWVSSSTGKAITVSDESLVLSTNTQATTQKFTIQRIESGDYRGLYKIMYGGKYVALSSSSSRYPTLTTTLNEYAVWSFMAEDKWCASVYDFCYPAGEISEDATDSTLYSDTFLSMAEGMGYSIFVDVDDDGNIINYDTNSSAKDAYTYMQSITEIMIYRGHATPGFLAFGDENGLYNGLLAAFLPANYTGTLQGDTTVYSIEALDDNALAHVRCVIYNGCQTGLAITLGNTDYNLVDATFEKGAHYVLGITELLPVTYEEEWFELFISYLESGLSIGDAVEAAVSDMGDLYWPMNEAQSEWAFIEYPYYAVGDGNQFLTFD